MTLLNNPTYSFEGSNMSSKPNIAQTQDCIDFHNTSYFNKINNTCRNDNVIKRTDKVDCNAVFKEGYATKPSISLDGALPSISLKNSYINHKCKINNLVNTDECYNKNIAKNLELKNTDSLIEKYSISALKYLDGHKSPSFKAGNLSNSFVNAGENTSQTIVKSLLSGRTLIVIPKVVSVSSNHDCATIVQTTSPLTSHAPGVILSPDSAYSTDSSATDDTFFRQLSPVKADSDSTSVVTSGHSPKAASFFHSDIHGCLKSKKIKQEPGLKIYKSTNISQSVTSSLFSNSVSKTSALSNDSLNCKVGKFRIGSFASFTNSRSSICSPETNVPTKQSLLIQSSISNTYRTSTPTVPTSCDILPATSADEVNPVFLDHDYCYRRPIPLPVFSAIDSAPKLGRPPSKTNAPKKKRPYVRRSTKLPKPIDENSYNQCPLNTRETKKIPIRNPCESVPEQQTENVPIANDNSARGAKVKITGNYRDDFIYYVSKSDRSTRRQRSIVQTTPLVLPPLPTAADIVVPRLSDDDLLSIKERNVPNAVNSFNGAYSDKESVEASQIEPMPDPHTDGLSSATDLSQLTTEQINILFSAIDEIQSSNDPNTPYTNHPEDFEYPTDDLHSSESEPDNKTNDLDPLNLPTSKSPSSSTTLTSDSSISSIISNQSLPVSDGTDNSPWIVIVTVYWNDLPAVMIDYLPYIRLIDIYKQILPAKDTGILKKRCQLLGLDVKNCSDMQRYFLIKYGHAHNSKSSLVISKDDATRLIAFYVEPQSKSAKSERVLQRNQASCVRLGLQSSSARGNKASLRDPHFIKAECEGRLRNKKINFKGLLQNGCKSQSRNKLNGKCKAVKSDKKPKRNSKTIPYSSRPASVPNKKAKLASKLSDTHYLVDDDVKTTSGKSRLDESQLLGRNLSYKRTRDTPTSSPYKRRKTSNSPKLQSKHFNGSLSTSDILANSLCKQDRTHNSSVITLTNGHLDYDTFTALDTDFS